MQLLHLVGLISLLYRFSCQAPAILVRLYKPGISGQIFEKSSNVTCHENPCSGSRDVARERTDRQIDTRKLTVVLEILRTSLKT